MALKQHIVIKDNSILEAIQTASLEWNYFSSRFYDTPAQVLKVRPLGLAWLLLQYDWPDFNTEELLTKLANHEEWKEVPCVLFYLPESKASAQKAVENFSRVQGIVPVPVSTPYLVEVFKHLIEPTKFPMPVPSDLTDSIEAPAATHSFAPSPELSDEHSAPIPIQNRPSQALPPPPGVELVPSDLMTKTGRFALPKMPAPPVAEVVVALPSIRGSRPPNSPFLAFKATSSLPLLSRPQAVPVPVINRNIPVPRIVSTGSQALSSGSYSDVALPKLPVFGSSSDQAYAQNAAEQAKKPSLKMTSQLSPSSPAMPRPSIADRARLEAEKALQARQAELQSHPAPGPAFGDEEPRYANLSLAKLRSTGSLPSYVPSPKAVAPKPGSLTRQTQRVPLPVAPALARKPASQALPPPRNPNTQTLPLTRSSPSQALPLTRNPASQSLPGVRKPNTQGIPMGGGPESSTWPPELLNSLETKLTELVGPLAKILLRKAARSHSLWPDLYSALLGHIANPEDQQDFASFCSSLPINSRRKSEDELLLEEADSIHIPLTSDLVYFFEGALQDYLGALGKVVLRQQVNEFRSTGGMVRNLAGQIHNVDERVDFLHRTIAALRSVARR